MDGDMAISHLIVMVVEDHGFQRRLALRLLAELGVQQRLEAADGAAALALLSRQALMPDVLLVDLDLPDMAGIEFIRRVAEGKLARAVVLACALDREPLQSVQNLARSHGLRVLGCIGKPMTVGKLQAVLEDYAALIDEADGDPPIEISPAMLRSALDDEEISAWFQPQATLANGQVVAVEVLARWQRPDGVTLRPQQFIPLLESAALIDRMTEQMLVQACHWKRQWALSGLHLKVSLNLSMHNLGQFDAADRYQRIVREHRIEPREVVLELTEASLMGDSANALNVLARLRLKGFGLSIDDFGTGYSSLAQLAQNPFTELKIDRSFVSGAAQQPRRRAVIEASLELARKLNLGVVAEGVEQVDDWQMLAELGCNYAQGYLIARPVPGDQVAEMVARWRRPEC